MSISLERSNSIDTQINDNSFDFSKRNNLMRHTRYYYNTYDSSIECTDKFSYIYRRELDESSLQYRFILNPQK